VDAGTYRLTSGAHQEIEFGAARNELGCQFNKDGIGYVNLQISQEFAREPLVDQDPSVLRIINELNYVKCSVFAFYQVRLGPSSHFANELFCTDRHFPSWGSSSREVLPAGCENQARPNLREGAIPGNGGRDFRKAAPEQFR
jgi:hypothetical protein